MQVNMLEAKTRLSQLVDAAEHGEEVVIARHGVPVAQIVPIPKKKFNLGFLKGKVAPVDDSLLFAMSEEESERFINGQD
jgi:prevent-host-death family protein